MYAIGATAMNSPLQELDLPAPRQPEKGELLLEMIAGGVGAWDSLLPNGVWEIGFQPPAAVGVEGAGRVVETGPDVTEFVTGDLVLVHEAPLVSGQGLWAERTLVRASHAARVPDGLSPQFAAALPVGGLTAVQSLDALGVAEGTRVLIVGASAPTAALAVQLAHLRGAHVVAGASAKHTDRLTEYGANEVIDTHTADWAAGIAQQFDAVLIAAEGTANDAITLLKDGGTLISITSDAPEPVRGITSSDLYVEPDAKVLAELAGLAAAGTLRLEVTASPARVEGVAVVADVVAGRSRGVKYVLEF